MGLRLNYLTSESKSWQTSYKRARVSFGTLFVEIFFLKIFWNVLGRCFWKFSFWKYMASQNISDMMKCLVWEEKIGTFTNIFKIAKTTMNWAEVGSIWRGPQSIWINPRTRQSQQCKTLRGSMSTKYYPIASLSLLPP